MRSTIMKRVPNPRVLVLCLPLVTGCNGPERSGVEEVFNFTPLAYYETSTSPPGYSVDVLWPLINAYRSGDARGSRFFPIYSEDCVDADHSAMRLFLLYGRSQDGATHSHQLWPMYSYTQSAEDKWSSMVLLLAGFSRDGSEHNRFFFPFYFDRSAKDENWFTLWPFYGTSSRELASGAQLRHDHVAWPLFRFESSSDDQTSGQHLLSLHFLAGLYDAYRQPIESLDSEGRSKSAGSRSSSVIGWILGPVFSLFHAYDDSVEQVSGFTLLSLFNKRVSRHFDMGSDNDSDEKVDLALVSSRTEMHENGEYHHSQLFPIYSNTSQPGGATETWVITPLYRHAADPQLNKSEHDVLFGLWHYGVEGDGATRATSWRLLPLLWFTTRPDSETSLVLPFYYHIQDKDSDYLHVIPFYGKNTEAGGKKTTTFVLTPLYIGTHDERTRLEQTDVLFPLISWQHSNNGSLSRFTPLWYYEEAGARTHWNSLLLVDRTTSEIESSTLVYPLWEDRTVRGEGRRRSLFPIFDFVRHLQDDAPKGDEFATLFPLASFRTDGESSNRWIFPFYFWSDDAAGHSNKMIWPFFGTKRDSDHVTRSVIWPFFFWGSDSTGDWSETGILYPLFASSHDRRDATTRDHSHLFPLYWSTSGENETGPWSFDWVLWPLWQHERKANGEICAHSLFKLGEYELSPDGTTEEFSILHAVYRYHREGDDVLRSVPFLFRYEREKGESTLYLFHFIPIGL